MHDRWAKTALRAYGAAQVMLALAIVPGLATMFARGANTGLGTSILHLAACGAALGFLVLAGAQTFRAAGKVEAAPGWGRAQILALAGLGVAAFALGRTAGGLLGILAAVFGAWALSSWTSHRPGGHRVGATVAVIAALAYILSLRNGVLAGLERPASFGAGWAHAVFLPGSIIGGLAIAALLTVWFAQGPLKRIGLAVVAGSLIIVGLQVGKRGLDLLGTEPWREVPELVSFEGFEVAFAVAAILLALLAGTCAIAWGILALARELPDTLRKIGHGFGEKDPGEACTACGWIPVEGAKFCMMCGNRLWTPEHQPPASP